MSNDGKLTNETNVPTIGVGSAIALVLLYFFKPMMVARFGEFPLGMEGAWTMIIACFIAYVAPAKVWKRFQRRTAGLKLPEEK